MYAVLLRRSLIASSVWEYDWSDYLIRRDSTRSATFTVGEVTIRKSRSGMSPLPYTYVAILDTIYRKERRLLTLRRAPLTLIALAS